MSTSTIFELLSKKLKQKRDNHPSFKLMDIEDDLFPDGMITFEFETEALDSDDQLKPVKDIVEESWNKPDKNHLMIEGIGGIGKTVTLLSLPDKFAPHYVPAIYIQLHELQGETSTIEKYIKGQVLDYYDREVRYGELMGVVGEPWDKGPRLLLLLDGFNEITNERRADVSQDIEHWSELPGIQIITSSRYDIRQYVALSSNYSKIELQALTPEKVTEYLHRMKYDVPANQAVMNLISTPLLLTLYIKTETSRICRQSPLAEFRETQNAGLLIWNYLQSELWRYRVNQKAAKACVLAMEFIAPYIAWNMQQHTDFVLNEDDFLNQMEDAYALLQNHFGNSRILPRHIKNTVRQTSRQLPEYDLIRNLLKEQLSLFNKQERKNENNARIVEYRLMHQQFRDALAALHLINMSYLSGDSLPQEWNTPVDYYVMQFIAELISEEEAIQLWEQNMKTQPAIEDATRNQLRLQGLFHNNDFTHLNFSGLDLTDISLYPYRTNNATIKLPTRPEWMNQTKFSDRTFTPKGHKGSVHAIAVTQDGKRIVSGSKDNSIFVWDLETGDPIGCPIKEYSVTAIAVTPDGKRIISGTEYNTIRVWSMESHQLLGKPIEVHRGPVLALAITPDGNRIVSGSVDKTICVWDLNANKLIGKPIKGHNHIVKSIAVTQDGKRIVSGGYDNTIRVWNLETGNPIGEPIVGHNGPVLAVAVTLDGKRIISGSTDKTIRVWNLDTGEQIGEPIKGHEGIVFAVAVTPNGKRIVSGSADKTIRVWNLETGDPIGEPFEGHEGLLSAISVTWDAKRVVSGSADKTIRVWNLETGKSIGWPIEDHSEWIKAVALTPDGKRIICGFKDNTIRVWDIETRKPLGVPIEGDLYSINAFAMSLDGKRIVSGFSGNTMRVWDIETGKSIGNPFVGHDGPVYAIAITWDGKRVISGSEDNTIRVWNMETSEQIGEPFEGHEGPVLALAVSRDGNRIVSGSTDNTILVWDIETGKPTTCIDELESRVNAVAITPDGLRIISRMDDCTIQIWGLETGDLIETYDVYRNQALAIASVQDSIRIVNIHDNNIIQIGDLEASNPFHTFSYYGPEVGTVAMTIDMDGYPSVRDLEEEYINFIEDREVRTIKIHPLSFVGLDFSKAEISDDELKETLRQNGAKV